MSNDCDHIWHWFPADNERGWKCVECDHRPGEPPGFCPELDRQQTEFKVMGLLHDLADEKFVSVSNGSMGDSIAASVCKRCETTGLYDQESIIRFILDVMGPSHADYWKRISDGIMAGNDPRYRCDFKGCSALASMWGVGPKGKTQRCSKHLVGEE